MSGRRLLSGQPGSHRIEAAGVTVAGAAVVLQTAGFLLDRFTGFSSLGLDRDSNPLQWVGVLMLVCAAFFLVGIAAASNSRRAPLNAGALGLAYLAVDHAFHIHQHVRGYAVIYLPLFIVVAVAVWLVVRGAFPSTRAIARVGLLLLLLSLALRLLYAPPFLPNPPWNQGGWTDDLGELVKEDAEIAGWILLTAALASRWVLLRTQAGPTRAEQDDGPEGATGTAS